MSKASKNFWTRRIPENFDRFKVKELCEVLHADLVVHNFIKDNYEFSIFFAGEGIQIPFVSWVYQNKKLVRILFEYCLSYSKAFKISVKLLNLLHIVIKVGVSKVPVTLHLLEISLSIVVVVALDILSVFFKLVLKRSYYFLFNVI